jgi:hypothetical protein
MSAYKTVLLDKTIRPYEIPAAAEEESGGGSGQIWAAKSQRGWELGAWEARGTSNILGSTRRPGGYTTNLP